jgi:hypothetical protein
MGSCPKTYSCLSSYSSWSLLLVVVSTMPNHRYINCANEFRRSHSSGHLTTSCLQAEFLNTMPPREFVDCITDDLLGQGVFVFTPSGAPMRLPKVLLDAACSDSSVCCAVILEWRS